MTSEWGDMSTPVTRGELRAELQQLEERLDQKLAPLATKDELDQRIAPLATRAELDQCIAPLATKVELDRRIAPLATRVELEIWGGALHAQIKSLQQDIKSSYRQLRDEFVHHVRVSHQQLSDEFARHVRSSHQQLRDELARHVRAFGESMMGPIVAIDDKYKDLPRRVSRIEAKVFPDKQR